MAADADCNDHFGYSRSQGHGVSSSSEDNIRQFSEQAEASNSKSHLCRLEGQE